MTEQSVDYQEDRRPFLALCLLSMSALFLELALIRWIPGSVRVAGYFTNMILLASFLGLGTGAILSRFERDLFRWWPLSIFLVTLSTLIFGALGQANPPGESEFVWSGGPWHWSDEKIGWLWTLNLWIWERVSAHFMGLSFYVVITTLFFLTALHFTLLGHRIGLYFKELPPLRAYGYDLIGAFFGVLIFTLMSRFSVPPVVWFVFGLGALALLTRWRGIHGIVMAILALLSVLLVLLSSYEYHWSPYYKIDVSEVDENMVKGQQPKENPQPLGYRIRVNNDYHQTALGLGDSAPDIDFIRQWRIRYDAPYVNHRPGRVLVLGAGGGNDVQAALRNGAGHVTAVEIDPRLAAIGRGEHPETPYTDPRVTVVVDDARSFLKSSTDTFDTIVFGFLDSHTLMTSFSTLRIDNYVYTVQSFVEAMEHLTPGGKLALSFASVRPFLGARLHRMLEAVSGAPLTPERLPPFGHLFSVTRTPQWSPPDLASLENSAAETGKWLATDNWPYLYLQNRSIPVHYLFFMALVLLLGVGSFFMLDRSSRRVNLEFFFLGAGFLLLETRSVTEMALLFGSTWTVNAIAFGSILLAVFFANLVVQHWKKPPISMLYVLVVIMLVVGYVIPNDVLALENIAGRLAMCALVLFSPIFIAGLVFSTRFKGAASPNLLFGSNLLGAMTGGALEYSSLVLGLEPLYLLGAVVYLLAFLSGRRGL